VPPPVWCDKEQVDEVALIEVAWPGGREAYDLAVLDGHQAGLVVDKGLDLRGAAEPVRVHGHDDADVLHPRLRISMRAVSVARGEGARAASVSRCCSRSGMRHRWRSGVVGGLPPVVAGAGGVLVMAAPH